MATGSKGMLSGLLALHEELERMIDDVLGVRSRVSRSRGWSPAADVFVAGGRVVVRIEVAGVRREDIDLAYSDGQLIVRGTRFESPGEVKEGYWQMEIPHGPFERTVKIPLTVDPEQIEAVCREGILEVQMPIVPDKRPAREVKVAADA